MLLLTISITLLCIVLAINLLALFANSIADNSDMNDLEEEIISYEEEIISYENEIIKLNEQITLLKIEKEELMNLNEDK